MASCQSFAEPPHGCDRLQVTPYPGIIKQGRRDPQRTLEQEANCQQQLRRQDLSPSRPEVQLNSCRRLLTQVPWWGPVCGCYKTQKVISKGGDTVSASGARVCSSTCQTDASIFEDAKLQGRVIASSYWCEACECQVCLGAWRKVDCSQILGSET